MSGTTRARYRVILLDENAKKISTFPFHELPAPGLQFEVGDGRWRVVDVTLHISRNEDEVPYLVECEVVRSARRGSGTERWEKIT
ncbi:hypothetical protein [Planomonospora venezuelensis]|uniref:Uncharacterized protein n=1 Tax=Planomonospora venezuelensis TaxID=1999 RepID=A0A841DDI8_PLAVE|nr:hypothetical protein [Planomonospora venezuelensis]MBB5966165.1 hypothetical protein [Planomonospora venezuelensis]GIN05804.1 hypothetical protein Pve01_74620 [Planomonospora venezuelensis]